MNLNATIGAGRVIANDYVISLSRQQNASRLSVSRGNELQTLDIPDGANGEAGRGILSAAFNGDGSLTLAFTDGTQFTTPSLRGEPGSSQWSQLSSVPAAFPPEAHSHPLSDVARLGSLLAASFDPQKAYLPGCICLFEGQLFRFVKTKSPGPWDASCACPTSLGGEVEARLELLRALKSTLTPAQLRAVAQSGRAAEYFDIGDVIHIPWTDYSSQTPVTYQYPFAVAHIGAAVDQDGNTHENAVYLQALCATPQPVVFDAPETEPATEATALPGRYYVGVSGTNYSLLNLSEGQALPYASYDHIYVNSAPSAQLAQYGSNRWSLSAVRQWLNSAAPRGTSWWISSHQGDGQPQNALTVPGFLSGFDADWLQIFSPVRVATACSRVTDPGVVDVTCDTFFLPSVQQMYGEPQNEGEGEAWALWQKQTGYPAPSNGSAQSPSPARRIRPVSDPDGASVALPLRSASTAYVHFVWRVYGEGYIGGISHPASYSSRYLPACVIL